MGRHVIVLQGVILFQRTVQRIRIPKLANQIWKESGSRGASPSLGNLIVSILAQVKGQIVAMFVDDLIAIPLGIQVRKMVSKQPRDISCQQVGARTCALALAT